MAVVLGLNFKNCNRLSLEQMLESTENAFLVWDTQTHYPQFTDSLWQTLGYPPGSFDNRPGAGSDLIHPEDRAATAHLLDQLNAGDDEYHFEIRFLNYQGEYRWSKVNGRVFERDATGKAKLVVASMADVHQLKMLQLQAQEQSRLSDGLRLLVERLFEAGDQANLDTALEWLCSQFHGNRGYLRLKDDDTGRFKIVSEWRQPGLPPMIDALPVEDEELLQVNLAGVLTEDKVYLRTSKDDLSERQIATRRALGIEQAIMIPLYFQGDMQGALAVMSEHDQHWSDEYISVAQELAHVLSLVFLRRATAKELDDSQKRFESAMQATQDGIWDMNLLTQDLYASSGFYHMVGYQEGELESGLRGCLPLLPEQKSFSAMRQLLAFVASEETTLNMELCLQHKDGSDVWVMVRARKTEFDQQGKPTHLVGVNTNITEFKRTLNKLERARSQANSANHAKSEFLARMSHEIRTPMNAILGLSHLLLEGGLEPQQQNYAHHIDEAARSLLEIIDDILDFSKIEAGKLSLEEGAVDLLSVISSLANLVALRAEQKNIELVFDVHPDVPAIVCGDATRLQQVLLNLLNNAIKFTERGGVYCLIAVNEQQELEFRVRDTGIGIAKKAQKQLFAPFAQADGSVTRRFGGTGLGLAICKNLVDMMQGRISLESQLKVGTELTVCLPLRPAVSQSLSGDAGSSSENRRSARPACAPQASLRSSAQTAAIVDSNILSAQACSHLLQRQGYGVTVYSSVDQLYASSKSKVYDLLLLDDRSVLINEAVSLLQQVPMTMAVYVSSLHDVEQLTGYLGMGILSRTRPLTPEKITTLLSDIKTSGQMPLSQSLSARAHTAANQLQWQGLSQIKILLVEDNLVNQTVACGMLEKHGVYVEVANDGLEAIDKLQGHRPDHYQAVFMDMEMPRMDGYQATQSIRQQLGQTELPIIAMTAHAMKGDREKCIAAGMNDYVSKPINPQALARILQKLMQEEY